MDCYSEYKYNHYQQQHNIHHTYYNNNPSMRFGAAATNDSHHPPSSSFYDGFSPRHNPHHPQLIQSMNQHQQQHPAQASVTGYSPSPFDTHNEGGGSQFYYPNMPPAPSPSYFNNHPYEPYRSAPSNYRGYNYAYRNNLHYPTPHHPQQQQQQQQQQEPTPHFQGHFYPHYNGNSAPDHFSHYPTPPPPSSTNTTIPSIRSAMQQQQGDFNASLPTASPPSTTNQQRSNEFSSTSTKSDAHEGQSGDKSIENESRHGEDRDRGGGGCGDCRAEHMPESTAANESEVQQAESLSSSISTAAAPVEESSNGESIKNERQQQQQQQPINNNDNNNNNNNSCSSSSSNVEEEQEVAKKLKNDSFNETENGKENHEDTSATGYSSEANGRINNKIHRDNERVSAPTAATAAATTTHIGSSRLSEHFNLNTVVFRSSANIIQNEYLFGLQQIRGHLNVSVALLIKAEQNFAMNITNLLIQYGESWIHLTNELFERDGFFVDVKSLYKFTTNIKARIKFDISRSIKDFSAGKITYMNKKLYQNFLASLFGILDKYVEKIKSAVNNNDELIECWDYYKTVFLEIGFDATNVLSKVSYIEIERLYNSFHHLKHKILAEIKNTKNILFHEYPSPLDNRLIINLYAHNFNDRSLTPIAKLSTIGYNHHYNSMELSHNYPLPKHRYPMSPWYSHDYYNNWILNPDDRRHFPDSHSFFSSMRNNKKNHFHPADKQHHHRAQHDTSPSSIKRTKRKVKADELTIKRDPSKELIKNLTPLPGFLQTFGQTEIGKFSEAFYISSDSPHYQYNNESDVDSPQPYDFDSLDGPIPKSFYMCGSETDSPMSNFSEIMCKDF